MPKLDSPLQLSPVFKLKIWGRENLSPLFSRPQELAKTHLRHELIGEVWITDDESRFMNSAIAGMTLAEASAKFGPQLCGKNWNDSRFPVLAKYIYTSDWLSVQVHPDDTEAGRYDPGNRGKSEMWYIVKSDRKAEILLGLKSGVTKDGLRAAFEKAASKKLLKRFHPKAGEAIYVPPGTVHALGPGLVLFEVEENSDLTYRLDDFGRVGLDGKPRPLHLDKGLAVTHVELPPLRDLPRVVLRETYGTRRFVLACPYFAMEELLLARRGTFAGTPERVEVLTVLDGAGRVETSAGWLGYRTGNTWLIPPGATDYRLVPRRETRLLKFYVPDLEIDFRRPLAKRGVRASKIRRIVFD